MFTNTGEKIKLLAKILFWILYIAILAGIFMSTLFPILTSETTGSVISIMLKGFGTAIVAYFVLWLLFVSLHAYGEMLDNTQKIREELSEIKEILKDK